MHQVLYRKWRPKTFSDVYGQSHIVDILRYEVEHNKISHAYLFCGSRGTGKTTCAKLLSKAVNCINSKKGEPCGECPNCIGIDNGTVPDVLELDAASNNGIDDIRNIREEIIYTPAEVKYRVYIIDEVHMLSISAFNALLKTLEEPPRNVIFILATTELQKLPATIISRCRRFDFRRIPQQVLADRLLFIAKKENILINEDALQIIARNSQGGMRDALCLMELASSGNSSSNNDAITGEQVRNLIGLPSREIFVKLVQALICEDKKVVFEIVADIYNSSKDIAVFWQELISFYRDMLVVKSTPSAQSYLDLTNEEYNLTKETSEHFTTEKLMYHSSLLDNAYISMQRNIVSKRLCAEMTLIRIICDNSSPEDLAVRVSVLEEKLTNGYIKPKNNDINIKNNDIASGINKSEKADETKINNINENDKDDGNNKRTLKILPNWAETLRRYEKQDQSTAAFLRESKAYTDTGNGNIIIKIGSAFAIQMLVKKGTAEIIKSIIGTDKEVIFENETRKSDSPIPLDEIIENNNDNNNIK